MHPKSSCRSVVAPMPNLSERRYVIRLVVVPCQYLPSPFPFFQPISPSLSSHISSVAVPHILHVRIHPCCPAYPPPCSSAAVFAADLVCHTHVPGATIRPQVGSRSMLIFPSPLPSLQTILLSMLSHISSVAVPHLLCRRIQP